MVAPGDDRKMLIAADATWLVTCALIIAGAILTVALLALNVRQHRTRALRPPPAAASEAHGPGSARE